jgi:hypothetical protein
MYKQQQRLFPKSVEPLQPIQFPLAPFNTNTVDSMMNQRSGIFNILCKLNLDETHPHATPAWTDFWSNMPENVSNVTSSPFELPTPQTSSTPYKFRELEPRIDSGEREFDVLEYDQYTSADRGKKRKVAAALLPEQSLEKLAQGQFVCIGLLPDNNENYKLPFLVAEIDHDIFALDTTSPEVEFQVQLYRPIDMQSVSKKFVRWQGDDNVFWRPFIKRGMVKGIVELTARGKKLTSKSKQLVTNIHF